VSFAITSALLLSVRIVLPGFWWTGGRPARPWPERIGRIVLFGLLLNLLPSLLLCAAGRWTPLLDWLTWSVLTAGGAWLNRSQFQDWRHQGMRLGAVIAIIAATAAVPLLLPARSEWVAGGWDPGIYQNNAVAIAHRNGLTPLEDTVFKPLTVTERLLLSNSAETPYQEIMPAVPIRSRDGALPLYFPPLTPVCGAWFYRMGGIPMLTRQPAVIAFLGLLPFLALCVMMGFSRLQQALALGFLLLSPVWWYHQAVPTSEMLYLLWIYGGLASYLQAMEDHRRFPAATVLVLFAATVNHFNAPVVAGLLLLVAACAESVMNIPHRQQRLAACFVALLAGICWGMHFSWITMFRLQEKDAALSIILTVILLTGTLASILASRAGSFLRAVWKSPLMRPAALVLVFSLLLLTTLLTTGLTRDFTLALLDPTSLADRFLHYCAQVMAFHGTAWFLLVICGGLALTLGRKPGARATCGLVVLALGGALALLLASPGITPIFPWALRRSMIVAIPLMAITQACATAWLLEKRSMHPAWRLLLAVLAVVAVLGGLKASRHAMRVGDYAGLPALLDTLDQHIQQGDIIITDDARWGTPLMLMHDRDVLNGERILAGGNATDAAAFLAITRRIQSQHQGRLLWLTSREAGLGIYPVSPGYTEAIVENIRFPYRTVIHGAHEQRFRTESRQAVFSLYEQITATEPPLTITRPGPHRLLADLSGNQTAGTMDLRWGGQGLPTIPSQAGGWQVMDLPLAEQGNPPVLQWSPPDKGRPPQFLLYAPGDPLHLIFWHDRLYPAGTRTPGRGTGEDPGFPLPFFAGAASIAVHISSDTPVDTSVTILVSLGGETREMKLSRHQGEVSALFPAGDAQTLRMATSGLADSIRLNVRLQPLYPTLTCVPGKSGVYGFQTVDDKGNADITIARYLTEGITNEVKACGGGLIGECVFFHPETEPLRSNLEDNPMLTLHRFHPREETGDPQHPYQRWTDSEKAFLQIAAPPDADVRIGIRLHDVRPPELAARNASLEIGSTAYPVVFSNSIWSATLCIPPGKLRDNGKNTIKVYFHSDTWSPAAVMPSGDTRTLGLLIDDLWLQFRTPDAAEDTPDRVDEGTR
jgi:hypothetical protein